jgi:hypothetical protein
MQKKYLLSVQFNGVVRAKISISPMPTPKYNPSKK